MIFLKENEGESFCHSDAAGAVCYAAPVTAPVPVPVYVPVFVPVHVPVHVCAFVFVLLFVLVGDGSAECGFCFQKQRYFHTSSDQRSQDCNLFRKLLHWSFLEH